VRLSIPREAAAPVNPQRTGRGCDSLNATI
jgi:hypothetical protein